MSVVQIERLDSPANNWTATCVWIRAALFRLTLDPLTTNYNSVRAVASLEATMQPCRWEWVQGPPSALVSRLSSFLPHRLGFDDKFSLVA